MKLSVTIGERRYKSNLKINQTLIFTNKCFFHTILGFTQSISYPLDDIDGFYPLIAGSYKSDKPINITGIDKVHLKCYCIDGSIMNGTRKLIVYSFALDQPSGHKLHKKPRIKLFKGINKRVVSHRRFSPEDDDYKAVDFKNETIIYMSTN